jgi:hypothetical protein
MIDPLASSEPDSSCRLPCVFVDRTGEFVKPEFIAEEVWLAFISVGASLLPTLEGSEF